MNLYQFVRYFVFPTSNFYKTAKWLEIFGKEVGNKKDASIQLSCAIEEITELLATLNTSSVQDNNTLKIAINLLDEISTKGKDGKITIGVPKEKRESFLDAACDAEVTINGSCYILGMNKTEADYRVLMTNFKKLHKGKPLGIVNGKIPKPKGWKPPYLSDLV